MTTEWMNIDATSDAPVLGSVEGYLSTSSTDKHGDSVPPRLIRKLYDMVLSDAQLQMLTHNHDSDVIIGYLTAVRLEEREGWAGVRGRAAITSTEAWEDVESGKLRGFSMGMEVKMRRDNDESPSATFRVHVPGSVWRDVNDLLVSAGATTSPYVRKAVDAETTITVVGSVASVSSLIFSLLGWLKARKSLVNESRESEEIEVTVEVEEERVVLTSENASLLIEKIKTKIEMTGCHERSDRSG